MNQSARQSILRLVERDLPEIIASVAGIEILSSLRQIQDCIQASIDCSKDDVISTTKTIAITGGGRLMQFYRSAFKDGFYHRSVQARSHKEVDIRHNQILVSRHL